MKFDVVTIFPQMINTSLEVGVVGRAIKSGLLDVAVHDLRTYADDRHRSVDDTPYGGGPGMVMKPEPFVRAVEDVSSKRGSPGVVILPSPQGRSFTHSEALRLSRQAHLLVLCGRYEGIDERVVDLVGGEELSIGDYVLSGGELAALVIVDAVSRLVPGVVGDEQSVNADSFSKGLLDHPHYTRPEVFHGKRVPDVLLSGHHAEVERWRHMAALTRTIERRPDLIGTTESIKDKRALAARLGEKQRRESHVTAVAKKRSGASVGNALGELENECD
jgi:tRNA (guanine37-N1)-methyltransferase